MLFDDSYKTISSETQFLYKERGSKFYAFAIPIKSDQDIKESMKRLKDKYPDASHHCYAYIMNPDKSAQMFSDDGEPGNTAGRPILRQINSKELTNVLVVVVRYFGGKKLGVSGLIESYGESAKQALELCDVEEKFVEDYYIISCTYANENIIYTLSSRHKARVVKQEHDSQSSITLAFRRNAVNDFLNAIKEYPQLEVKFLKSL
jgi:uncharacterized YigZ family protein